ncbi:MAG: hypothetical protein H6625_09315 [Bdellovibrionaceae bacterium]|nr:hypothetical protein [Pseudobdellovibrionaceae bacterium]
MKYNNLNIFEKMRKKATIFKTTSKYQYLVKRVFFYGAISLLIVNNGFASAQDYKRDYVAASGHVCQRLLLNMMGPPFFLAGISKKITWISGPMDGLWRRWGEGLSPYGWVNIFISKPLKDIERDGVVVGSVPDVFSSWDSFGLEIEGFPGRLAATTKIRNYWLGGFENTPGVTILIKESSTFDSPQSIEINIKSNQLPKGTLFKEVVSTIVYRVLNPPKSE